MNMPTDLAAQVRLPSIRNFIGGDWHNPAGIDQLDVMDPATERRLGQLPVSGPDDVDAAVKAARSAFESPAWRGLPPLGRERLLHRLADLIDANAQELAMIESLDNGKPIAFSSTLDVPLSAMWFRYFGGWPSKLGGRSLARTTRTPCGSRWVSSAPSCRGIFRWCWPSGSWRRHSRPAVPW